MTRIFDNINDQLGPHLQETLKISDRIDVAVGYFNLRGWSAFNEIVKRKSDNGDASPIVRVLIGMVMTGPQQETLEALQTAVDGRPTQDADANDARARRDELIDHLRTQLMRGLPTAADRLTLQSLRDLLGAGVVEIKVFTRRPLHGKTYVCHRRDLNNPITGFVGSSNLTAPGLWHNLELNVDVLETGGAQDLARWFQDRWDDRFSRRITKDVLDLIDQSWAGREPRRPYEVFLKVCYDLSRDVREGLAEYSVPQELRDQLLEYQATAVQTLARRIMTRGGTMLGDVVGLGKTLTAVAVALMLREHGYMPLVVCPRNLVSMWEEHFTAYEIHGRVVSYTMAHAVLPELRRYAFVIVDESHTLRNSTRRDYKAIQDYIHANDSKVLLLTATPYNIRFLDVANQLGLYIDDDDDLGISPVNALAADPRLADKVDGKTTTMLAFRRSEFADDWKRLMSEHLVRRTRTFIRTNYGETDEVGREYLSMPSGGRFYFPSRIPKPVEHSFGDDDPAAIMASDTTLDVLTKLVLPRYDLAKYIDRKAELSGDERAFIDNLLRGRGHVAGFVRTTFYKRLSSCGHSFTVSLKRHITRNELWTYAIDNGLSIPTGAITENAFGEDDDPNAENEDETPSADPGHRYQSLLAANPAGLKWVRSALFRQELRVDLDTDTNALRGLLAAYGEWIPERDSKLMALMRLIQQDHPTEKILVFTEYKDTAVYIASALHGANIEAIGVATGDSENPTELAQRFSPRSNRLPGKEDEPHAAGPELRVLVATDVLSEGQNLQDAHIVVNYDLPWAIIRLIQRAGRVDRVGQTSDRILLYSFFHESIDNVIGLRRRIGQRLRDHAQTFGSDERFFDREDEVAITDLYNGKLADQDDTDDVDASSLAYQRWQQAQQDDPETAARIARLPDMISATRKRRIIETEDRVMCYVRTESGIDGFGEITHGGENRLLTGHEILRSFEADPQEPGLELLSDHDELIETLVKGPLATPHLTAGRLRGTRRMVWNRLSGTLSAITADIQNGLDALYQNPLTRDAENRIRRSIRNGAEDTDLASLIGALHRDGQLVITTRAGNDPIRIVSSMGIRQ